MAIENIVSKVYRVLTDVSSRVWDKISFWCLAKDVELANGKNLETTCGSITGITSSLTSTSTTMAASASAIKQLNDKIADLNSNLSYQLRWSSTEYKGSSKRIDCGFKPKYIFACSVGVDNTTGCRWFVYDSSVSTTQVTYSVGDSSARYENIGSDATFCLSALDDTGFTMTKDFFNQGGWCFAIK